MRHRQFGNGWGNEMPMTPLYFYKKKINSNFLKNPTVYFEPLVFFFPQFNPIYIYIKLFNSFFSHQIQSFLLFLSNSIFNLFTWIQTWHRHPVVTVRGVRVHRKKNNIKGRVIFRNFQTRITLSNHFRINNTYLSADKYRINLHMTVRSPTNFGNPPPHTQIHQHQNQFETEVEEIVPETQ